MKLSLAIAESAAQAARKKATEAGISITVSVVDDAGRLVLTMRGDGSGFLTTETSRGKALAAAAFGRSTQELVEMQKNNPAFWNALPAFALGILPTTGAVPLKRNGQLIGAIGCGGGTAEQDHACALAGTQVIEAQIAS